MKNKFKWIGFLTFILLSTSAYSVEDLDQVVSGGEVEDSLAKVKSSEGNDPYLINSSNGELEKASTKNSQEDFLFKKFHGDLSVKENERKKLEDVGYTPPGTYEKNDTYLELDRSQMASEFRNKSSGAFSFGYIQNNYNYTSPNDVINRTIGMGYRHIKGGTLHIRSDSYFFRKDYLNLSWVIGAGFGYNSGRAIFITGDRSESTFRLYEVPLDLGIGLEFPVYHWFKISGSAGPSAMTFLQNRSDFQRGEKGKNKIQFSYGEFASAQFKFNFTGMSPAYALELFSESKITNLLMNFELRYHNYQNFQDDIKVSGLSMGIGFTFEYL